MSEHELISAQESIDPDPENWPAWEVQGYGTVTGSGDGAALADRDVCLPWVDVRLTFADGARLDVLAVVRDGRIAIEDAQAEPPLALDGLAALAVAIEASLHDACRVVSGRPAADAEPVSAHRCDGAAAGGTGPGAAGEKLLSYPVSDQRLGRGAFGSTAEVGDHAERRRLTTKPETEVLRATRPDEAGTTASGVETGGPEPVLPGSAGPGPVRPGPPGGDPVTAGPATTEPFTSGPSTARPSASCLSTTGSSGTGQLIVGPVADEPISDEPDWDEPTWDEAGGNEPGGGDSASAGGAADAPITALQWPPRPVPDRGAPDVRAGGGDPSPGRHRADPSAPRGLAARRDVAEIYRTAQREGRDPVLAVMSATGLSRRRSLRLIAGARDRGFLTPRHHRH